MSEVERKQQEGRFDITEVKTVLLVGIFRSGQDKRECEDQLKELERLSTSCDFAVESHVMCPIKKFNPATYVGTGKVEEIAEMVREKGIDAVIFDDELAPKQQKNIEEVVGKPVLDRTELILEVFAKRAQTREAVLQIELAKVRYQLPRLRRMWTHLSRERVGGSGTAAFRGAGESQIELDRRVLKERAATLEREIKEVRAHRTTQRGSRLRSGVPTFAIVGYTNSGKSTLLNALTDANVFVEDRLFATLDTTSRAYVLPNRQNIVLIDTVGFIRKLPHTLVAAFRSTLEESIYTDILLHVVDVSHPNAMDQAKATLEVLKELGVENKPIITVLNKVDRLESEEMCNQFRIEFPKTVRISALEKRGFDDLLDLMLKEISSLRKVVKLRIPQSEYALATELMREGSVIFSDYEGNDILLEIEIPARLEYKVRPFYDADSL